MIREVQPSDWRGNRFPVIEELTSQYATECAKLNYYVEAIKLTTGRRAEVTIKNPNVSTQSVTEYQDAVDAEEDDDTAEEE